MVRIGFVTLHLLDTIATVKLYLNLMTPFAIDGRRTLLFTIFMVKMFEKTGPAEFLTSWCDHENEDID